jgi:hypothetical protein
MQFIKTIVYGVSYLFLPPWRLMVTSVVNSTCSMHSPTGSHKAERTEGNWKEK